MIITLLYDYIWDMTRCVEIYRIFACPNKQKPTLVMSTNAGNHTGWIIKYSIRYQGSQMHHLPWNTHYLFWFPQNITVRHNENDGVWNHQPYDCLLNRLFRRRSNKTSKLRVTGLCVGNSSVTGEFHAQMACNAENVSIWWHHYEVEVMIHPCWAFNSG